MGPDSTTLSTVGAFVIAALAGCFAVGILIYKLLSHRYQERMERLKAHNKTLPLAHGKAPSIYLLYSSLGSLTTCVVIAALGYQALYHWLPDYFNITPTQNGQSLTSSTVHATLTPSHPEYVSCEQQTGAVKITRQDTPPICLAGEGMLSLNISNVVRVETNANYAGWTYITQSTSNVHTTPSTGSYNCPHGLARYVGKSMMRMTHISLAKTAPICSALSLTS